MIGLCHKCLKSNVEVNKDIMCNDCVEDWNVLNVTD